MLSDEEKKEYEELKSLLYTGTISQYGKRKLIDIIEKQQKEIEKLKENNGYHLGFIDGGIAKRYEYQDKIIAKIEIRKEEKENCKDSIEEKYLLREIYDLQSLLEKE